MNKNKKKIIISIILIITFLSIFIIRKHEKKNNNMNNNEKNIVSSEIKSNYNNETGMYEIVDEVTGEVIVQSEFEEEISTQIDFYKKNPEYRANPPVSPNAGSETK